MKRTMPTERLRREFWLLALFLFAALTLSACDLIGTDEDEQAQQQQQSEQAQPQEAQQVEAQQETPAPPPAATAAAQPSAPRPPVARGGGGGERAYSIVYPSLARVSVGDAVATGLVTSEGLVLVDGALLGDVMAADVLLSNGDVFTGLPVQVWEKWTGLVYLGPLDAAMVRLLPGARLGDGEGVRPGSTVFAVGYGSLGSVDAPLSIHSGVLSGVVESAPGGITILRTDIDLPLQTGGMLLVDAAGTVIGVAPASTAGGGWYISTGDLARNLNAISAGPTDGEWSPIPVLTATEHTLDLGAGQPSVSLFLADDGISVRPLLTVRTETPSSLSLFDAAGELLQEANLVSGATIVSLSAETYGPYEIVIAPAADAEPTDEPPSYEISANVPLTAVTEVEEMATVQVDAPLMGSIDIVGDVDTFNFPARAGAIYEIFAQSFLIDPYLAVSGAGILADDDDSGGGLFNLDAALTVEPTEDGLLRLAVSDYSGQGSGAYLLTVRQIGGPPEPEPAAEDEEDAVISMPAAMLPAPAPPPAISMRGIGGEEGLRATLLGINSESVGNGLLVDDRDGAFEVIVSVLGRDGALGNLTVTNIAGGVALEGRVLVSCAGGGQCLAQAVFVSSEASDGPWVVELRSDEPGIDEWQIEVERGD